MQTLLDAPRTIWAIGGTLLVALSNVGIALARGLYRIRRHRLARAFEPPLEASLGVWAPRVSERIIDLHASPRVKNVGDASVRLEHGRIRIGVFAQRVQSGTSFLVSGRVGGAGILFRCSQRTSCSSQRKPSKNHGCWNSPMVAGAASR